MKIIFGNRAQTSPVTEADNQKKLQALFKAYPKLAQPGMVHSVKAGKTGIMPVEGILEIFSGRFTDPNALLDIAQFSVGEALELAINRAMEKEAPASFFPLLVNLHFDLAQTILHEGDRLGHTHYLGHAEGLEQKRGEYLAIYANRADSTPDMWAEYGYWLVGRADKFAGVDDNATQDAVKSATHWFRKADEAGVIDASDALATLTYQYDESDESLGAALDLWIKAAAQGHKMAIENLAAVVIGDPELSDTEKTISLGAVWQGIDMNKQTEQVRKQLRNLGLTKPKALLHAAIN